MELKKNYHADMIQLENSTRRNKILNEDIKT